MWHNFQQQQIVLSAIEVAAEKLKHFRSPVQVQKGVYVLF